MKPRAWSRGSSCQLALLLLLAGCASAVSLQTHPPEQPQVAHAIAVYPFLVRSDSTPDRGLALGNHLAERIAQSNRYAVFGPGEFQVHVPDGDAIFVLTDLATAVPAAGVSIDGLVVLRGWLERRVQSASRHEGDPATDQVSVVGHLELVDAARSQVLAEAQTPPQPEASAEHEVDQLADRMLDALPELAPGEAVTPAPLWLHAEATKEGLRISQPTPVGAAAGLREGSVVVGIGDAPSSPVAIARAERLLAQGVPVEIREALPDGQVRSLHAP